MNLAAQNINKREIEGFSHFFKLQFSENKTSHILFTRIEWRRIGSRLCGTEMRIVVLKILEGDRE